MLHSLHVGVLLEPGLNNGVATVRDGRSGDRNLAEARIFQFFKMTKLALGLTEPPTQWNRRPFQWEERPGLEGTRHST
jgi:hypothetical protein